MRKTLTRLITALTLVISTLTLLGVTMDEAEARRIGGGSSFGRQSTNIMKNRAPAQAPRATQNTTPNANQATANRGGAAAGAQAQRSGMSRFLGPIAGIAAGLGIAALLSSLGLAGPLLEFLSSAVLIAIVIFGVMFIVRRLRGNQARPATQGAFGGQGSQPQDFYSSRETHDYTKSQPQAQTGQTRAPGVFNRGPETQSSFSAQTEVQSTQAAQPLDPSWFVPEGFDTMTFLNVAKDQFVRIQGLWDRGDVEQLKDYLTDDLITELSPQIIEQASQGGHPTEVVLLNAELLGMEQVAGGHLASVRFSGMLREEPGQEAFRFEEVWNLYKTADTGWLLAGIQQIPSGYES
ncbi:MAG: TIM44-like domain-containing protein [Alcaligenaceae bacterium]|nr:TIM44-like domain-containing protein [Alcaligenaceae bacterium]